jgi:hypothetical protein
MLAIIQVLNVDGYLDQHYFHYRRHYWLRSVFKDMIRFGFFIGVLMFCALEVRPYVVH